MELSACGQQFTLTVAATPPQTTARQLIATSAALFGDLPITASLFQTDGGHEIDLGEFGAFTVAAGDSDQIQVLRWPAALAQRQEFLLGPALLASLAARHIFALHASAFRIGSTAAPTVAVTAPSGTGKSTLARAARQRGWERLADDLLPTSVDDEGIPSVWPHFPQLKLPADQQYPAERPLSMTMAALVVLERGDVAEITRLDPKVVMHTVLSSTISSRLFPPAVMQAHLRFATALADAVAHGRMHAWRLRVRADVGAPAAAADEALSLLADTLGADGSRP